MIKCLYFFPLLICLSSSMFTFGQDPNTHLILNLIPNPKFNNLNEIEISLSVNEATRDLILPINRNLRISEGISNSDLFLSLSIKAENLPEGYKFHPVNLKIPHTQRGRSNTISVCPITISQNLGSISRVIWSTNVNALTLEKKFDFFQITSEVFINRKKLLADNWQNLSNKDVQVAFKYLEVVRELTKECLTSSSEIENTVSWLITAINNNSYRVSRALGGIESANQIIEQIKSINGLEFARLYRAANNMINNKAKYERLKLLIKYHNSLPSNELREKVLKVSKITESLMINDLAAAFNNSSLKSAMDESTFLNEVDFLISKIDHVLQIEPRSKLKSALVKSRKFFINLKTYRQNNEY